MPQCMCGSHRTTFGSQFSSSLYGPRDYTQVVAWLQSFFIHWAISLGQGPCFFLMKNFRSAEEAMGVTVASASVSDILLCSHSPLYCPSHPFQLVPFLPPVTSSFAFLVRVFLCCLYFPPLLGFPLPLTIIFLVLWPTHTCKHTCKHTHNVNTRINTHV